MEPPKIDLAKSEEVLKEFFDDDKWVKDEFSNYLSQEIMELSVCMAAAFAAYPRLNKVVNDAASEQAALVAGFVFGVIDDILVVDVNYPGRSATTILAGRRRGINSG